MRKTIALLALLIGFFGAGVTAASAEAGCPRDGSTVEVQCLLNYTLSPSTSVPLPVDGVHGPRTTRAVRTFQSCAGLAVTGVVDPQTLAALRSWAQRRYDGEVGYIC